MAITRFQDIIYTWFLNNILSCFPFNLKKSKWYDIVLYIWQHIAFSQEMLSWYTVMGLDQTLEQDLLKPTFIHAGELLTWLRTSSDTSTKPCTYCYQSWCQCFCPASLEGSLNTGSTAHQLIQLILVQVFIWTRKPTIYQYEI